MKTITILQAVALLVLAVVGAYADTEITEPCYYSVSESDCDRETLTSGG